MENQQDMSGALFKNTKQRNDKDPGYQGSVRVNGVDYWLSAWLNTSKNGEKYFGLKVKPKNVPKTEEPVPPPAPEEDDVPF